MIKKNCSLFFYTFLMVACVHTCNAHLQIDSTINLLEQQTKLDDEYLGINQECSIIKQEKRKLNMELRNTKKELEIALQEKAELEKSLQKAEHKQKEVLAEKRNAFKHLKTLTTHAKQEKRIVKSLKDELAHAKLQQKTTEHQQLSLKQELCTVYKDLEKHMKISQEHAKLQQQLAQAKRDLQSPYATTLANLQSGRSPIKQKNS